MMARPRRLCMALLLCASASAVADMPPMQRVRNVRYQHFGDVTIEHVLDSRKDPMSPQFTLKMFRKKRLLMELHEVAFGDVYASPGNTLFVGLSNGGWPSSAVIIFDLRGKILLLANHNTSAFDYCMKTSTMFREWYDGAHPDVTFPDVSSEPGRKPGITLRDCHGNTVDLLDTVHKANAAGMTELRDAMNFYR